MQKKNIVNIHQKRFTLIYSNTPRAFSGQVTVSQQSLSSDSDDRDEILCQWVAVVRAPKFLPEISNLMGSILCMSTTSGNSLLKHLQINEAWKMHEKHIKHWSLPPCIQKTLASQWVIRHPSPSRPESLSQSTDCQPGWAPPSQPCNGSPSWSDHDLIQSIEGWAIG